MPSADESRSRFRLFGAALWICLSGCTTLGVFPTVSSSTPNEERNRPAISQEGIVLEVYFVERLADDPLLGDVLWRTLDQIGSVSPETRENLQANGLRFGIAGRNPGYALMSLLRATKENEPGNRTARQEYQTPSGVSHQFATGSHHSEVSVTYLHHGERDTRQYKNARGIFKCRVETTQDGWIHFDLLPQIHYGQYRMRPVASGIDWDLDGRQEEDTFYSQRFQVDLNQGEYLVLGADGDAPDSLGACFFRDQQDDMEWERLLVIHVVSVEQVEAVRQSTP